jgi:hypothetical protein
MVNYLDWEAMMRVFGFKQPLLYIFIRRKLPYNIVMVASAEEESRKMD